MALPSSSSSSSSQKRVVVTGATGYIGQNVIQHICAHHLDKYNPVALIRCSSTTSKATQSLLSILGNYDKQSNITIVDYTSITSVLQAIHNADIIIHLAFDMDFFPSNEKHFQQQNHLLTSIVLQAANEESKLKTRTSCNKLRFIFISSTEAIGYTNPISGTRSTPLDESAVYNPSSAYGQSKVQCEQMVSKSFYNSNNLDVIIMRPTGVYGVGERFFFWEVLNYVSSGLSFFAPSPMSGTVMFTHIYDIVKAILLLSEHDEAPGKIFNVCPDSQTSLTYRQVTECIAETMGNAPSPVILVPVCVGKVLMRLIRPIMNFGKNRVFLYHERSVEETVRNRWYDNSRIKGLGFRPKYGMKEGIQEVVKEEIRGGNLKPSFIAKILHRLLNR